MSALVTQVCAQMFGSLGARTRRLRGFGVRLAKDKSGVIAVPFALMTIVLCLFVGAGVDIGRWLHARQQTISAMDAAVLAGGRALQLNPNNLSGAIAAAQAFYVENTKHRLPLVSDTITFKAEDNNTKFTAQGNAYIATPLLGLVNITKLPLIDTSGTEHSKSQLAVGGLSSTQVEIALMLDVTGSMAGTKIDDMKTAAKDLVDIVMATDQGQAGTKIALIPFATEVRLPSSSNVAARGSPASTINASVDCGPWGWMFGGSCSQTFKLTPCVVERKGAEKYTDAAPGSGQYVMAHYDTNASCDLSANETLQPLTNDKSGLKSMITSLSAKGGTAGQIGTAWAWYTLSPNWNALWSASNQAGAYSTTLKKIAILFTDGEYNTEYDTNGVVTYASGNAPANDTSTNQARSLCTAMKAKGIEVYTVGFELGGNQTAITTLSQCATDSTKYYNADSGEELKQAFRDIALKINQLFLTQ